MSEAYVSRKTWVEIFFTEDIDLTRLEKHDYKEYEILGEALGPSDILIKTPECTQCNVLKGFNVSQVDAFKRNAQI